MDNYRAGLRQLLDTTFQPGKERHLEVQAIQRNVDVFYSLLYLYFMAFLFGLAAA
jgi:hypothetical protein